MIFQPGLQPESDTSYLADRQEYHIYEHDGRPAGQYYSYDDLAGWILADLHDVCIDLGGAEIIFHARMIPFIVNRCERVTIRNFKITYTSPPFGAFEITDMDSSSFTVRTDGRFTAENGSLVMRSAEGIKNLGRDVTLIQPFDAVRRTPARYAATGLLHFGSSPQKFKNMPLPVTEAPPECAGANAIRFCTPPLPGWNIGQNLIFLTESREYVGIFLAASSDITIEQVRMRRVAGMGILGFLCRDIRISQVEAWCEPDCGDMLSINADGIHMLHCFGKITVEKCRFEHMMDDAGNFHGQFLPVLELSAESGDVIVTAEADLKWMNSSFYSIYDFLPRGAVLTVYKGRTPDIRGKIKIEENVWIGCTAMIRISSSGIIPLPGDHLLREDLFPEVTIRECVTGYNRPRGFLISTPKRTLVEKCVFRNSSVGLDFTGDMNYWCEATGVRNVLIRDNLFENCGHAGDGVAISAHPDYTAGDEACFHSGIKITGNTFRTFANTVARFDGCRNIVWEENRIERSHEYKPMEDEDGSEVVLSRCTDCTISLSRKK